MIFLRGFLLCFFLCCLSSFFSYHSSTLLRHFLYASLSPLFDPRIFFLSSFSPFYFSGYPFFFSGFPFFSSVSIPFFRSLSCFSSFFLLLIYGLLSFCSVLSFLFYFFTFSSSFIILVLSSRFTIYFLLSMVSVSSPFSLSFSFYRASFLLSFFFISR